MSKPIHGKRVNADSIEREIKRRLKAQITTRIRARYEHGTLVLTGDVDSQQALHLIDDIVDEMLPNADIENRVHIRLRSEVKKDSKDSNDDDRDVA